MQQQLGINAENNPYIRICNSALLLLATVHENRLLLNLRRKSTKQTLTTLQLSTLVHVAARNNRPHSSADLETRKKQNNSNKQKQQTDGLGVRWYPVRKLTDQYDACVFQYDVGVLW